MGGTEQARLLVADDTPVDRAVVRFFLEGHGFRVVGESSSADDLVRLARRLEPDAVVVGDRLGGADAAAVIPRLREAVPGVKVVQLSSERPTATPPPPAGADAYLEKGVGFQALASVLATLTGRAAPAEVAAAPGPTVPVRFPEKRPSPRLREAAAPSPTPPPARAPRVAAGLIGLAAAVALVAGLLRAIPERPPSREVPREGGAVEPANLDAIARLQAATVTLGALRGALEAGDLAAAIDLARRLMLEREAAILAGANVVRLDAAIAALAPLLASFTDPMVWGVFGILDPLLPPVRLAVGSPAPPGGGGVVVPGAGETGVAPAVTTGGEETTGGGGGGGTGGGGGGGGGNGGGGGGGGNGGGGGGGEEPPPPPDEEPPPREEPSPPPSEEGEEPAAPDEEEEEEEKGVGHEECRGKGHAQGKGEGHAGDDCEDEPEGPPEDHGKDGGPGKGEGSGGEDDEGSGGKDAKAPALRSASQRPRRRRLSSRPRRRALRHLEPPRP